MHNQWSIAMNLLRRPMSFRLIVFVVFAATTSLLFTSSVRSQEDSGTTTQYLANPKYEGVQRAAVSDVRIPVELHLAGIWSFVATTHGSPSEADGKFVQRGHWSVAHDGGGYLTAHTFDKNHALGRRFLIRVHAKNGTLVVEEIDIEANYAKRFGIGRFFNGGSKVELAFNVPLDGSQGQLPTTFDSTSAGFQSIVLTRISHQGDDSKTTPTPTSRAISVNSTPKRNFDGASHGDATVR